MCLTAVSLLVQVETLSGSSQVELAEMIIKGLKEGHHASLELFPKLLACITAHKSIRYQKRQCRQLMPNLLVTHVAYHRHACQGLLQ